MKEWLEKEKKDDELKEILKKEWSGGENGFPIEVLVVVGKQAEQKLFEITLESHRSEIVPQEWQNGIMT